MNLKNIFTALFFLLGTVQMAGSETRFGIGAGLNLAGIFDAGDEYYKSYGFAQFYFPIQFDNFRIEPEVGFFNSGKTTKYPDLENSESDFFIRLGAGAFISYEKLKFRTYLGPRLAFLSRAYSSEDSGGISGKEKESQSYFSLAACYGAEYLLDNYFSIGAEFQLNWISYQNLSRSPEQSEDIDSQYSLSTNVVIFLRFFI